MDNRNVEPLYQGRRTAAYITYRFGKKLGDTMAKSVENVNSVRRAEILETALGLFGRRGFEGTPMSAIAEALGMSKAGLYHHFRTKDDILRALFYPSFEKVEALLDEEPGRRELLQGYLEIMLEDRELATLLGSDVSVLARPDIGERALRLNHGLQARLVEDGVARGSVAEGRVEGAGLAARMRAECALGVLRSAVVSFPEADKETVRSVTLEAAYGMLGPEDDAEGDLEGE